MHKVWSFCFVLQTFPQLLSHVILHLLFITLVFPHAVFYCRFSTVKPISNLIMSIALLSFSLCSSFVVIAFASSGQATTLKELDLIPIIISKDSYKVSVSLIELNKDSRFQPLHVFFSFLSLSWNCLSFSIKRRTFFIFFSPNTYIFIFQLLVIISCHDDMTLLFFFF